MTQLPGRAMYEGCAILEQYLQSLIDALRKDFELSPKLAKDLGRASAAAVVALIGGEELDCKLEKGGDNEWLARVALVISGAMAVPFKSKEQTRGMLKRGIQGVSPEDASEAIDGVVKALTDAFEEHTPVPSELGERIAIGSLLATCLLQQHHYFNGDKTTNTQEKFRVVARTIGFTVCFSFAAEEYKALDMMEILASEQFGAGVSSRETPYKH